MINHGKTILRQRAARQFKGKVQSLLSKWFSKMMFWSLTLFTFVGGWCAMQNALHYY